MKITIGSVELVQWTTRDTRDLYRIRNHGSVRRYMANPSAIPYQAHVRWVRDNLIAAQRLLLFMVRAKGRALGFTLLKKVDQDTAEIGVIFKEPDKHPVIPYTATVATLHHAFCRLHLAGLVSYVVPTHQRAIAINRSFGAWEVESDKAGMLKFRLSRDVCLENPNYRKVLARMEQRMCTSGTEVMGPLKGPPRG